MQEKTSSGDESPVQKICRVSGRIAPGGLGEVMVEIRGGSEAFLAQALNMDETYERGERLVVVEYHPPRTVIVARHNKGETIS